MNECRPFRVVNKVKFSVSIFEDQRLEQTDFAVVHDSSSIGAGPSVALFQKLEDGESSDKVCPGGPPSSKSHGSCSVCFYCSCNSTELKYYT